MADDNLQSLLGLRGACAESTIFTNAMVKWPEV